MITPDKENKYMVLMTLIFCGLLALGGSIIYLWFMVFSKI